jgi:hemerythrin superfamily protein
MARSTSSQDAERTKDVFEVLSSEHKMVSALLEQIETACEEEDFERAASVFEVMNKKLTAHAKAEEQVVYPRFASEGEELEDTVREAVEEHKLVEEKLMELTDIDASDPEWKAKFTVLKELVEHHVEDEEGEAFPEARKQLDKDDARALAREFLDAKIQLFGAEIEMLSEIELEVMTKEQLLDKARDLGIEGTSSMNKEQLTKAMRRPGETSAARR